MKNERFDFGIIIIIIFIFIGTASSNYGSFLFAGITRLLFLPACLPCPFYEYAIDRHILVLLYTMILIRPPP